MNLSDEAYEYGSWKADGHPLLVEYSRSVLDSIGAAISAAFQRGSGVGAEIGGVLFGKQGPEFVRIQAWRPLPLEQADASRLALGPADELNLQRLIKSAASDPKLGGLEPIGWTQSTLRRSIALVDAPLEIYKQYFPEPSQVVLLIRPSFQRPTMAGFFFREADGNLRCEASHREFLLLPPKASSPAAAPEPVSNPEPAPRLQEPEIPRPSSILFAESAAPSQSHALRWALYAILALLIVAGAIAALPRVLPKAAPSPLRMSEIGNQLRIDWDLSSEVLRGSQSATLSISDDGRKTEKTLLLEELRGGSFTYQRSGTDVSVRMLFLQPGKPGALQATRFLGQPVAESMELKELRSKIVSLETSLASAKEDARTERARARRLDESMKILQRRVDDSASQK